MNLRFVRNHLSIEFFQPIEISDLAVVTGTNGAGKSHLLKALKEGAVTIDDIETSRIAAFDSRTFLLRNEDPTSQVSAAGFRRQCWKLVAADRTSRDSSFHSISSSLNSLLETSSDFLKAVEKAEIPLWSIDATKASELAFGNQFSLLERFRTNFDNFITSSGANQEQNLAIASFQRRSPKLVFQMTEDEFCDSITPYASAEHFLVQQFSRIFVDYHSKFMGNKVARLLNQDDSGTRPAVSDEDFRKKHGVPPWETVNHILSEFTSVHLRVTFPTTHDQSELFRAEIIHADRDSKKCSFDDLSSGEKTILALVAAVFNFQVHTLPPKLVLLDEIDSSLHPSMIKNMYQVIEDVITSRGIKTMIVTHSPTTVALAPENSLYLMRRVGVERLQKTDAAEAVDVLTEGFATLSEGIRIFDHIANSKLTIITEGYNTEYLELGLRLKGLSGVSVLRGLEHRTGKSQLKTIFDFLSNIPPMHPVIFVWDCDMSSNPRPISVSVVPYVIPRNSTNLVATDGIENAFPSELFDSRFVKRVVAVGEPEQINFNKGKKSDFLQFVKQRARAKDFDHFDGLFELVRTLIAPV
jgi:ABC-type uncharacterized transport system ATPase component